MAIAENMEHYNQQSNQDLEYELAAKKVKRLKGFYTHLLVYILVNIFLIVVNFQNLKPGESYFQYKNFITAFFWGIGLVAHAFSVFVPQVIFGKNWEDRKIKELMEKDKFNKYQ